MGKHQVDGKMAHFFQLNKDLLIRQVQKEANVSTKSVDYWTEVYTSTDGHCAQYFVVVLKFPFGAP